MITVILNYNYDNLISTWGKAEEEMNIVIIIVKWNKFNFVL